VAVFDANDATAVQPGTLLEERSAELPGDWAPVPAIAHASLNSPDGSFFPLLPDDAHSAAGTVRAPRRRTWRRSA
jgi:hypothetical protein